MQVFPEFQNKFWALNTNHVIKKTMMPKYFMHNIICYLLTIDSLCTWKEMPSTIVRMTSKPLEDGRSMMKSKR